MKVLTLRPFENFHYISYRLKIGCSKIPKQKEGYFAHPIVTRQRVPNSSHALLADNHAIDNSNPWSRIRKITGNTRRYFYTRDFPFINFRVLSIRICKSISSINSVWSRFVFNCLELFTFVQIVPSRISRNSLYIFVSFVQLEFSHPQVSPKQLQPSDRSQNEDIQLVTPT